MTTVVIVTYNSAPEIERTVSLLRSGDLRVSVVDNHSSDGTREILQRLYERHEIDSLVLHESNLGFAGAVNECLIGCGEDEDVLLLNPDARIDATSITELRRTFESYPPVGVVAPLVHSGEGISVLAAGRQPKLWAMFTHLTGLARAFPKLKLFRGRHLYLKCLGDTLEDVEWVSGCCMLISARARKEVGILSDRWFVYGEDVDYCRRMGEAGFRVVINPAVRADHEVGVSVSRASYEISTLWARNLADYYEYSFSPQPLTLLIWKTQFRAFLLSRFLWFWTRGRLLGNPALNGRARQFLNSALAV